MSDQSTGNEADQYPKLRFLEAFPYFQGEKQAVLLRDPLQISSESLIVSPQIYAVLGLLDGRNSLLDIQVHLTRHRGTLVFREEVESLVSQLDRLYYLDNQNFRDQQEKVRLDFQSQSIRKAFHAGQGYPEDPVELNQLLSSFYSHEAGAGQPGKLGQHRTTGILAPHIDLRLGGPAYTHAYRALAESEQPDVFVILGIGHNGLPGPFSLSRKDYETPLGRVRHDGDFLALLEEQLGTDHQFDEDLSHRTEHTIEFQLLFLQHLFPESEFGIVPILSSFSFQDLISDLGTQTAVEKFADVLRRTTQDLGKRTCLIGSVDLAHIGPQYGDSFHPDESTVKQVMDKDLQMLEGVKKGDPGQFIKTIRDEQDRRRICGFSAIYTLLKTLEGQQGELLAHDHAWMGASQSFVTFASMSFTDR